MNQMIETITMAIVENMGCGVMHDDETVCCNDPRLHKNMRSASCDCQLTARAVLEAMRPMVPKVTESGEAAHEIRGTPQDVWHAFIDGALRDE